MPVMEIPGDYGRLYYRRYRSFARKEEALPQKQSPIFSKTYDFLLWLMNHTEKFPKSERFRLARRMEDSAFAFYELLLESTRAGKAGRLQQADLELDKLRLYVRLSHGRNLFDGKQYEFAVNALMEIGKLLGGWIKSVSGTAANPGGAGGSFARGLVEQQ